MSERSGRLPKDKLCKCRKCDKPFFASRSDSKWCSRKCENAARWIRRKVPKPWPTPRACKDCSNEFMASGARHVRCEACSRTRRIEGKREYYARKKDSPVIQESSARALLRLRAKADALKEGRKCEHCDGQIERKMKVGTRFCSSECSKQFYYRNRSQEKVREDMIRAKEWKRANKPWSKMSDRQRAKQNERLNKWKKTLKGVLSEKRNRRTPKAKERARVYARRRSEECSHAYVKSYLASAFKIRFADIPEQIIEAKRAQMLLRRDADSRSQPKPKTKTK